MWAFLKADGVSFGSSRIWDRGLVPNARVFGADGGKLSFMTATKDDLRRERLREFDGLMTRAGTAVTALALLVQGREARAGADDAPLEMIFAGADVGKPALPAGLWVALRRGDILGALDLLVDASDVTFVVGEREEMGSGYRLETVAETRGLPDVDLLQAQLAAVLDIPLDVVALLAAWGADDPRTATEVNALLDARFAAAGRAEARSLGSGTLSMSVDELADVLQLAPEQAKVLATLARRAAMTITPNG
jgi:hypothetical protein